jgi:hypothetical protein
VKVHKQFARFDQVGRLLRGSKSSRRGTLIDMAELRPNLHWNTARDLIGLEPPSDDDIPVTASGERLDSSHKIRQFIEQLNLTRAAAASDVP